MCVYNLKKQKKRVKIMVNERGFHRYINQTRSKIIRILVDLKREERVGSER
jgi:hypothetical protein